MDYWTKQAVSRRPDRTTLRFGLPQRRSWFQWFTTISENDRTKLGTFLSGLIAVLVIGVVRGDLTLNGPVGFVLLIVIGIPLALLGIAVLIALWLAVLGYIVAGWFGAFIGFCTTLLLWAIRRR
jgi:hypothetical protein